MMQARRNRKKRWLWKLYFLFCPGRGIMQTKCVFLQLAGQDPARLQRREHGSRQTIALFSHNQFLQIRSLTFCFHIETEASSLIKKLVQSKKLLVSFDNADLSKGKDWTKPSRVWYSIPTVFLWAHSEDKVWKTVRGKKLLIPAYEYFLSTTLWYSLQWMVNT